MKRANFPFFPEKKHKIIIRDAIGTIQLFLFVINGISLSNIVFERFW